MPWDSTQLADWQIAEEAEKNMPKPYEVADRLGMKQDEVIPYGRVSRLDYMKILDRLKDRPQGKYVEITAITPTPLGEGKTTTTMGIIEGLAKGARTWAAPSGSLPAPRPSTSRGLRPAAATPC